MGIKKYNKRKHHIISEAGFAAFISLILFGPILGFVLDGYDFTAHPVRPFAMSIIVFIGKIVYHYATVHRSSIKIAIPSTIRTYSSSFTMLVLFVLIIMPFFLGKYWISVINLSLIYVLLGLGLNIVVGLAGLLDLGFVAFYAVGAYGYALSNQYLGLGFWSALVIASTMAGTFGAILGFPVLRLHGDYLAIVTLGFGEIISLILTNWTDFTGGPNGTSAPLPTLFGLEFRRRARQGGTPFHEYFGLEYEPEFRYLFLYVILLIFVIMTTRLIIRLKKMPIGRAWEALREDEIACKSLGINHVNIKLSAFSMGATIGGMAGVFFAGFQGFIDPLSFNFFESALILAVVVLGGMGSTFGVILSAIILTMAPEFLREFSDYRILFFGLLMVFMMIWKPKGLIQDKRNHFQLNKL